MPNARLVVLTVAVLLSIGATAAELIEAVGAKKCGGRAKSFTVEFLAPEDATSLVASAEAKVAEETMPSRTTASLSLDGQACRNGECSFSAKKGQTYTFVATSELPDHQDLCISVSRR
jgi:hypothetical protein